MVKQEIIKILENIMKQNGNYANLQSMVQLFIDTIKNSNIDTNTLSDDRRQSNLQNNTLPNKNNNINSSNKFNKRYYNKNNVVNNNNTSNNQQVYNHYNNTNSSSNNGDIRAEYIYEKNNIGNQQSQQLKLQSNLHNDLESFILHFNKYVNSSKHNKPNTVMTAFVYQNSAGQVTDKDYKFSSEPSDLNYIEDNNVSNEDVSYINENSSSNNVNNNLDNPKLQPDASKTKYSFGKLNESKSNVVKNPYKQNAAKPSYNNLYKSSSQPLNYVKSKQPSERLRAFLDKRGK